MNDLTFYGPDGQAFELLKPFHVGLRFIRYYLNGHSGEVFHRALEPMEEALSQKLEAMTKVPRIKGAILPTRILKRKEKKEGFVETLILSRTLATWLCDTSPPLPSVLFQVFSDAASIVERCHASALMGVLEKRGIHVSDAFDVTLSGLDSAQLMTRVAGVSFLHRHNRIVDRYSSPEILKDTGSVLTAGHESYVLAILFMEAWTGIHPFEAAGGSPPPPTELMAEGKILYGEHADEDLVPLPARWRRYNDMPAMLQDIVERAFREPASKRPSIAEWQSCFERSAKLLETDGQPAERKSWFSRFLGRTARKEQK